MKSGVLFLSPLNLSLAIGLLCPAGHYQTRYVFGSHSLALLGALKPPCEQARVSQEKDDRLCGGEPKAQADKLLTASHVSGAIIDHPPDTAENPLILCPGQVSRLTHSSSGPKTQVPFSRSEKISWKAVFVGSTLNAG